MNRIDLTPARFLNGKKNLLLGLRADIYDYGWLGQQLTGPWAKTAKFVPRPGDGGEVGDGGIIGPTLDGCVIDGGTLQFTSGLAAGASDVRVSPILSRPFVITHVELWAEVTTPAAANVQAHVKVGEDQDRTGGLNTSGAIMPVNNPTEPLEPFNVFQHFYPNWVERGINKVIKIAMVNNTAGAVETMAHVDWKFLAE